MCNVEIMNNDHTQVLKLEQNRPAEAGSEEQKHANDRMQREIADMYNTDGLLDLSYGEEDNDEMVHDMPTMVQDTHAMVHEPPFQQKPAITPIADMTVLAPPPESGPNEAEHPTTPAATYHGTPCPPAPKPLDFNIPNYTTPPPPRDQKRGRSTPPPTIIRPNGASPPYKHRRLSTPLRQDAAPQFTTDQSTTQLHNGQQTPRATPPTPMYTTAFTPTPKCTNWLATTSPLPSPPPTDSTPPLDRFLAAKSRALEQITPQCVPELQYALRARGLPVSGLRKDLLERLAEDRAREATQLDSPLRVEPPELRWLDRLRVPELKEMCRKRDLPVGGLKADLKERLVGGF